MIRGLCTICTYTSHSHPHKLEGEGRKERALGSGEWWGMVRISQDSFCMIGCVSACSDPLFCVVMIPFPPFLCGGLLTAPAAAICLPAGMVDAHCLLLVFDASTVEWGL